MREIKATIKQFFKQVGICRGKKMYEDRDLAFKDACSALAPGVIFNDAIVVMVLNQADKEWESIDRNNYENAANWVKNDQAGLPLGEGFEEPEYYYRNGKKTGRRHTAYADKLKYLESYVARHSKEIDDHESAIQVHRWAVARAQESIAKIKEIIAWFLANGYDPEKMTDEKAEKIWKHKAGRSEDFSGTEARI